jgi:CarD family transcriptional regulator
MTTTKKSSVSFTVGEAVVYPAHGVGRITSIEEQEVAGFALQVFVVVFEHNRMTLRIPVKKAAGGGLRKIAEPALVEEALEVLSGRARPKRGMWSRKAQELEAKIKSGELLALAEVVRDFYRAPEQAESSYSERTLYEAAVEILGREVAAVHGSTSTEAQRLIEQSLAKAPRPEARSASETDGDENDDAAA